MCQFFLVNIPAGTRYADHVTFSKTAWKSIGDLTFYEHLMNCVGRRSAQIVNGPLSAPLSIVLPHMSRRKLSISLSFLVHQ